MTSLTALIGIALCGTLCVASADKPNIARIDIALHNLPAIFSQDKLPGQTVSPGENSYCSDSIGCVERLPKTPEPIKPEAIGARFQMHTKQESDEVEFNLVEMCLEGTETCASYQYNLAQILGLKIDLSKPVVIAIPGYMSKPGDHWLNELKDDWFEVQECNVILVSWEHAANRDYPTTVASVKVIARQVSILLYYIATLYSVDAKDSKFANNIHCVGHSLGAHACAFISQDFNNNFGRISGLDPAGPMFDDAAIKYRLDRSSAKLVVALHTNSGTLLSLDTAFGISQPIGHVDFYANDGTHQPGCKINAFGCSHKLATDVYSAFLAHDFYMRKHMDDKFNERHRMYAFRADDYEQFHSGTSLMNRCPVTSIKDDDQTASDLTSCIAPVDFTKPYNALRDELTRVHKLDLALGVNKFYFYTRDTTPYLNNHNAIKIRAIMPPNDDGRRKETECHVHIKLNMRDGTTSSYEVKKYKLRDMDDHYEIVAPYLAPDTISKYELSKLDAYDFFLDDERHERLYAAIEQIFPQSIDITGLRVGQTLKQTKSKPGFFAQLKSILFGSGSSNKKESIGEDSTLTGEPHECSVDVQTITVQPLIMLKRHLSATYTVSAINKPRPDIVDMNAVALAETSESNTEQTEIKSKRLNPSVHIDSIVIGPPNLVSDAETNGDDGQAIEIDSETSGISGKTWLTLTVLMIIAISIFFGVSMYKMLGKSTVRDDRLSLITDINDLI